LKGAKVDDSPFFSIITVTRNAQSTIENCVQSIINQDFQDFEYIVIDGHSTDLTPEILKKYAAQIDVLLSESDDGLYFAMNKGLNLARGKVIGIISADDILLPGALSIVAKKFQDNPGAEVVYGAAELSTSGNSPVFFSHQELNTRMILHPSTFVALSAYASIGNFNTKYRIAADYDLMLRFNKAGVIFQAFEGSLTRIAPGGASSKFRFKSILETYQIQKEYVSKPFLSHELKLLRVIFVTYVREAIGWFKFLKSRDN
jgi:glycosyltransferase involved in cell wall biosynthesis